MLTYAVALENAPEALPGVRIDALRAYRDALNEMTGDNGDTARAYFTFESVMRIYGQYPLPHRSSENERQAVSRWLLLDRLATELARAQVRQLDRGAYFVVTVSKPATVPAR